MKTSASPLLSRITCPNCWHEFPPFEVRWVAAHQNLIEKEHGNRQRRFLPSHFDVLGRAIDPLGEVCTEIACPHCQLTIARDLLELPPVFLSILGAPSSGKSYFLAAAMWQLRNTLGNQFQVSLADSDSGGNGKLIEHENTLFHSGSPDVPVAIDKTQRDGDLYQQAFIRDQAILYARPFLFRLRLEANHPRAAEGAKYARTVCLYDNAGENFLPGGDSSTQPGTRHLAVSKALLFLFDPTQHPKFRELCAEYTNDPQMSGRSDSTKEKTLVRQDQILNEAKNRISASNSSSQKKLDARPLIVVVTKFDSWKCLAGGRDLTPNWMIQTSPSGEPALHLPRLMEISDKIRELLGKHVKEVLQATKEFSDVTYIPVSALGTSPELGPPDASGKRPLQIRPRDIKPQWIEIPLLYALHRSIPGLIPVIEE